MITTDLRLPKVPFKMSVGAPCAKGSRAKTIRSSQTDHIPVSHLSRIAKFVWIISRLGCFPQRTFEEDMCAGGTGNPKLQVWVLNIGVPVHKRGKGGWASFHVSLRSAHSPVA